MQRSRALKKKGETLDYVSCFPQPTLLSCSSRFLRALKLHEQSTVKASLVVNYNYNFSSFQSKTDSNTTIAPKTASCPVIRFFGFCWTQLAFFQLFITFMIQTAHSCPSKTASYEEFKPPLLKSFLRGTNILRSRKGVHKLTIKSETLLVKFPGAVMHVYVTPKN